MDHALSQAEADALIALPKHRENDEIWDYPSAGTSISVPLVSQDRRERFLLDIQRSRIDLVKRTLQNRARHVIVLVRLDLGGAPHRNPDGVEIASPHLHVYREDFGDKWAIAIPKEKFGDSDNAAQTLQDFMDFCNVVEPPMFQMGLFS